jgi:hypothetical protein
MKRHRIVMQPVLIRGDGVAAYCCAHLLQQAGIPAVLDRPTRPRLPAIMLSEAAISLLADVFGRSDLFHDLPRIRTRTVLWGSKGAPLALPHSAVVVSEQVLLDSLRPEIAASDFSGEPQWTVFASRPLPPGCVEHGFGSRVARASSVALKSRAAGCWVESAREGWLFLIAGGDGTCWLLSVGGADPARSRLFAEQIEDLGAPGGEFPASPRIIEPLSNTSATGQSWLACGTAALAFDPLCGDGTAHAVREAILAAAVIRATHSGAHAVEVLAHYESRLLVGFQRHLANCAAFYRTGGDGTWWRAELHSMERGLADCAERLSRFPGFRYRLNGYELELAARASDGLSTATRNLADRSR